MESIDMKMEGEFTPREYQVELYEEGVKQNIIIYLPTGSGKTYIAAMLINHFSHNLQRAYTDGGQRIFFLVNTIPLVMQQAAYVRRRTPFNVGEISGESKGKNCTYDTWLKEFDKYQVMVMTVQIFLQLLLSDFIQFDRINLLIFDECHHAVLHHPMRQVFQLFNGWAMEKRPRIIGLTASLLNANLKEKSVENEIRNLELTMNAKVSTATNRDMVKLYSTKPKLCFAKYKNTSDDKNFVFISKSLNGTVETINEILDIITISEMLNDTKNKIKKKLINGIKSLEEIFMSLGVFALFHAVLCRLIYFERLEAACYEDELRHLVRIAISDLILVRKLANNILATFKEYDKPIYSNKLNVLISIIKKCHKNGSTLVFVKKRITAQVLCQIFKELSINNKELSAIKAGVVVSFNTNDTKENLTESKVNRKTLEDFAENKINLLFATDVVEEGIDVPICNEVIMFDDVTTFRSYIQSKGRARHEMSNYIIFQEVELNAKFRKYQDIEDDLNKVLVDDNYTIVKNSEEEIKKKLYDYNIPPFCVGGRSGAKVTEFTAISLVNRYCSTLPQDRFCHLTVTYWVDKIVVGGNVDYVAFLKFPINCPIRRTIQGPKCADKMVAKRAVALKACEELYKCGELDDSLLPLGKMTDLINDSKLYPRWDKTDSALHTGTKMCKRLYRKKFPHWMYDCSLKPGVNSYIHPITITLKKEHLDRRYEIYRNALTDHQNFSIITSKPWPQITNIPISIALGTIDVELTVNRKSLILATDEINKLKGYHWTLFSDILNLVKDFLIRGCKNKENDYILVPTITDSSGDVHIDWSHINSFPTFPKPKLLSRDERKSLVVSREKYEGKIVLPTYSRPSDHVAYLVVDLESNLTPSSNLLEDGKSYNSYKTYMKEQYQLDTLNMYQPLILTYPLSATVNYTKPVSKKSQGVHKIFVPEFCHVLDFPPGYLVKATLLPAILHRITQLFLAEELRLRIAADIQMSHNHDEVWKNLCSGQLNTSSAKKEPQCATRLELPSVLWKHQGKVFTLDILKALTSVSANDIWNYERLETLGDSFIKFVTVLALFTSYRDMDEGKLNAVKSKLVGNKNIFYCGKSVDLGSILQVNEYMAKDFFIPQFCVPNSLKSLLKETNTQYKLPNIKIPDMDRRLGKLSKSTALNLIHQVVDSMKPSDEESRILNTSHQEVSDKTVADSVEAIIGQYLKCCGPSIGMKVMSWFGIMPERMLNSWNLLNMPYPSPRLEFSNDPSTLLPMAASLENTLDYKFKDRAFLLQAFTHPSSDHTITDCYQRIEFLGDAIIDFLLTTHIYEAFNTLSPAEITDLRAALVNNSTFASLSAKYGFHRHLLSKSFILTSLIQKFVEHQEERGYPIGSELVMLINEKDTMIGKYVDAPKVLGDIFESVIGAVYLDSKCLLTVWKVLYRLIHIEIEKFSKNIPKNPVRVLFESFTNMKPVFMKPVLINNGVQLTLEVLHDGERKIFHGIGDNKKRAKLAAAKVALNYFGIS